VQSSTKRDVKMPYVGNIRLITYCESLCLRKLKQILLLKGIKESRLEKRFTFLKEEKKEDILIFTFLEYSFFMINIQKWRIGKRQMHSHDAVRSRKSRKIINHTHTVFF
jgi:hypothetical protein